MIVNTVEELIVISTINPQNGYASGNRGNYTDRLFSRGVGLRIPLTPQNYLFEFKIVQFPLKVCFAMTINKAQGQTLNLAGVDLRENCFSHGQLYVACSRVSSRSNLVILAPEGEKNVYKEILRLLPHGLLTYGDGKRDVVAGPLIPADPFSGDSEGRWACSDPDWTVLLLVTVVLTTIKKTMSSHEEDPSVNGRLRPRKAPAPEPPRPRPPRRSAEERAKKPPSPTKQHSDADDKPPAPAPPQALCLYCDKRFALKKSVAKHISRIHKDTPLECPFCKQGELDSATAIRHMVDTHSTLYFACLECHTRFQTATELTDHDCDKNKPKAPTKPYRYKLRQKIKRTENKRQKSLKTEYPIEQKDFAPPPGFNGIVISCELKPSQTHNPADIEDNITTNLILPSNKSLMSGSPLEKNAVIVLDDVTWNKRVPANFSFHSSDADQILSRLGVVHRSPRGDCARVVHRHLEETAKFERCFDTAFYTKVASNVHENMTKFLDGSFTRLHHDPDSVIKTRKAKNIVAIHTAEGFPILLACEQFKRNMHEAYMPRAIAPKHKWKWDSVENDRALPAPALDQMKRDAHVDKCIITLVSSLDTWTQLSMRRRFDAKYNSLSFNEKKTEKQNVIGNELKDILESRVLPQPSAPECVRPPPAPPSAGGGAMASRGEASLEFPLSLGLVPRRAGLVPEPWSPPAAVLTGECVRPRCLVCCACGERAGDARALAAHSAARHPGAHSAHYEVVGEVLLHADILRHLYVPPRPARATSRARPPRPRGARDCTKCAAPVSLDELHEHMLDCAGDAPAPRRKVRPRPFGVRRRRPRAPPHPPRKNVRKLLRARQQRQKHMRARPKLRTEVGDAETIRKMIADLPAKRHRSLVTPTSSSLRALSKREMPRNKPIMKRRLSEDPKTRKPRADRDAAGSSNTEHTKKEAKTNNKDDKPPATKRVTRIAGRVIRQSEVFKRKVLMRNAKRKSRPIIETSSKKQHDDKPPSKGSSAAAVPGEGLSLGSNAPQRVDVNKEHAAARSQAGDGSGRQNGRRPGDEGGPGPGGGSGGGGGGGGEPGQPPPPLKHSIARLTASAGTHDKAVQFQPHFLVQQECYKNFDSYRPAGPRREFEDDAVTVNIDKPPLDQPCTIDPYAHLRGTKLGRPRKRLTDCIAMLKNKLDPEATSPGTSTGVQCGPEDMPDYDEPTAPAPAPAAAAGHEDMPDYDGKPAPAPADAAAESQCTAGSLLMEAPHRAPASPPPPPPPPADDDMAARAVRATRKKRDKKELEPESTPAVTAEDKPQTNTRLTKPDSSTDSRTVPTATSQVEPTATPREQRRQSQTLPVFTVSPPSKDNSRAVSAYTLSKVLPPAEFMSLASGHYVPAISPTLEFRSQKITFPGRASVSPSAEVRSSAYSNSSISPSNEVRSLAYSRASESPSNEMRSRAHSSSSASPSNDLRSLPYYRASVSPSNDLRGYSAFSRASVSPSNDARIHSMSYAGLNISPSREMMYYQSMYSAANKLNADGTPYPSQSESYLTAALSAPYVVTSTSHDYSYHTRPPGYEPSVLRSRRHKPAQSQPLISPPKHRPKKKYAATAAALQQAQEMRLQMIPPEPVYPVVEAAAAQRRSQAVADYRRRSSTRQFTPAETAALTATLTDLTKYSTKRRVHDVSSTRQASQIIQQRQNDTMSQAHNITRQQALTDHELSSLQQAQDVSHQRRYEKEYQTPEAIKSTAHNMTRRSASSYDNQQVDSSSPSSFRTTSSSSVSPTSSTKEMPAPNTIYDLARDFNHRQGIDYAEVEANKHPVQDRAHQISHEDYVQNLSLQNEYPYRQNIRDMQSLHPASRTEGDYSVVHTDTSVPPAHLNTGHMFSTEEISGPLDLSGKGSSGQSIDQFDSYGTIDLSSNSAKDLSADPIKQVDEVDIQMNEPEDLSIRTRHNEPDDCFVKPTCPVSESAKRIYGARAKAKMAQSKINRSNLPMATYDMTIKTPDLKVRGLTTMIIEGSSKSETDILAKCPVSITVTNTITSCITSPAVAQGSSNEGKSSPTAFKSITPVTSAAIDYNNTETAQALSNISESIKADDGEEMSQHVYALMHASNTASTSNSNSSGNLETRTNSPTISITHTQAIRTEIIPQIGPVQDLDTANKIAMLPKEIVEILGQMPSDHRNQLLNVLPQYMVYNTAVKQLKFVVDITPEPVIAPVGVTSLSEKSEIATQTATSTGSSKCPSETTNTKAEKCSVLDIPTERAQKETLANEQMKAITETVQEHAVEAAHLATKVQDTNDNNNKRWMPKNDFEDLTPLATPGPLAIPTPADVPIKHIFPSQPMFAGQTTDQKEGSKKTASLRAVRIKMSGKRKSQQNLTNKPAEETLPPLHVTDSVMVVSEQGVPTAFADQHVENVDTQHGINILMTDKPETIAKKDNYPELTTSEKEISDSLSQVENVSEKFAKNMNSDQNFSSVIDKTSPENNTETVNTDGKETERTTTEQPIHCTTTVPQESNGTEDCDEIIKNKNQFVDEDDSDDDVSLAVIVKNKRLSQCNLPVEKSVNTRNKKPKKSRGKKLNHSCNHEVEIIRENKKLSTPDILLNKSPNIAGGSDISAHHINEPKSSVINEINTEALIQNPEHFETAKQTRKGRRRAVKNLKHIIKRTTEDSIIDNNLDNKCDSTYNKENKDDVSNIDKKARKEKGDIPDENGLNKATSPKVEASAMADVVNVCTSSPIPAENALINTPVFDASKISPKDKIVREEAQIPSAEDSETNNPDIHVKPVKKKRSQAKKLKNRQEISSQASDLTTAEMPFENVAKDCNAPEIEPIKTATNKEDNSQPNLDLANENADNDCNKIIRSLHFKLNTNSVIYRDKEEEDTPLVQMDEEIARPLRRSNRKKSVYVETPVDDPEPNKLETVIENKAPLTKKQLIFSKLLLDEENRIEQESKEKGKSNSLLQLPQSFRSETSIIDKVSSSSDIVSNVSNTDDICSEQLSVASPTDKRITTKRKKSPYPKRSTKKKKSVCEDDISQDSKTSFDDNIDPGSSTTMTEPSSYTKPIAIENTTTISQGINLELEKSDMDTSNHENGPDNPIVIQETDFPETGTNITSDKNLNMVNQDTVSDDVSDFNDSPSTLRKTTYKKTKSLSLKNINHVTKRKPRKPFVTLTDTTEDTKLTVANIENMVSSTLLRNESNKSTCYDMPRAAARTRSKSVLLKSILDIDDVYDPYDIDLEERMLEKLEPVTKKTRKLESEAKDTINSEKDNDNLPKDEKTDILDNPVEDLSKVVDNDVSRDLITNISKELRIDELTDMTTDKLRTKDKKHVKNKTTKSIPKINRKNASKKSRNSDDILPKTSNNKLTNKEISSDTDESSKSDIPLKNYVTEASKTNKKMKLVEDEIAKKDGESEKGEEKSKKKKNADAKRKRQPEVVEVEAPVAEKETAESADDRRSEQFMESFGFFSERKPRKSNLLASKKISETFHIIANDNDDLDFEPKERHPKRDRRKSRSVSSEEASEAREPSTSVPPLKQTADQPKPRRTINPATYCILCRKEFRRPDNFVRHHINMFHIYKMSLSNVNTRGNEPFEIPNYLVIYRQHLERLKRLTEKIMRKNKKLGLDPDTAPKVELPTLTDIMADATMHSNSILSSMQKEREMGLSDDEVTYLHCCQLLRDGTTAYSCRYSIADYQLDDTSDEESDAEPDTLPPTTSAPSEQARNADHVGTSALNPDASPSDAPHTVAAQMLDPHASELNKVGTTGAVVDTETEVAPECTAPPSDAFSSPKADSMCGNFSEPDAMEERVSRKSKKSAPKLTEMYDFDLYEDKFDMIKRKSRSCAAAAKQPPQISDTSNLSTVSQKGKKKTEKKTRKTSRKSPQGSNTIPTKAALKGFDAIKESTLDPQVKSPIVAPAMPSCPAPPPPPPPPHPAAASPPRKKKKSSRRRKRKSSDASMYSHEAEGKSATGHAASRGLDVYEFDEDADQEAAVPKLRAPRPLLRESAAAAPAPAPPAADPPDPADPANPADPADSADIADHKSDIASDESFVYMSDSANDIQTDVEEEGDGDDEHDGGSSDSGAGAVGGAGRAGGKLPADPAASAERRDARAKHTVMGKIFKHNALRGAERRRTEPRVHKHKEPQKDLDLIFDSLLGGPDEQPSAPPPPIDERRAEPPPPPRAPTPQYRCSPDPPDRPDRPPYERWSRLSPARRRSPSAERRPAEAPPRWDYDTMYGEFRERGRPRHRMPPYPYYYRQSQSPRRLYSPTRFRSESTSLSSGDEGGRSRSPLRAPPPPQLKPASLPAPGEAKIVMVKRPAGEKRRSREAQDEQVPGTSRDVVPLMTPSPRRPPSPPPAPAPVQRARRKCALGKQNVLAESWSSESEAEVRRARARSAESLAPPPRRKKSGGARHKRQEPPRPGVAAPQPRPRADALYSTPVPSPAASPDPTGAADPYEWRSEAGLSPAGSPEPGCAGGAEPAPAQQHGWIVGDSHKKLMTMLASIKVTSRRAERHSREREERHSRHSHKHGKKRSDKKRHGKKRDDKKRRHNDV